MDKVKSLILKHLSNELNSAQREEFEKWLNSDKRNLKLLTEYSQAWELTKNYPTGTQIDPGKALEIIHTKAGISKTRKLFTPLIKIAIAASLVAAICLLSWHLNSFSQKELIVFQSDSIVKEIVLPDQTHVWLNKYSKLSFQRNFKKNERKVFLEGEGYFEVFKNKHAPFYVVLHNSEVQVLGTHFNVKEEHTKTCVSVLEGRVKFFSLKSNKSQVLNINEKAILDHTNNSIHKKYMNNKNIISWKTNMLEFNETPIKDILVTVGNHFNVKAIRYKNQNKEFVLSALFKNKSIEEILNSLSQASDLDISLKNDTITVQ